MTKAATRKKLPTKSLVYLNEYNLVHDNSAYLPLVSGCLHAHAITFPAIRDSYEFAPYSFKTDLPDNILLEIEAPEVAAFSLYTWSTKLSLHVAKEIKSRNPNSLIIFGY